MQEAEFSVDHARIPWNRQAIFVKYNMSECARIKMGLEMMTTVPNTKKEILIALPPLANGTAYFVAVVRVDRTVRIVQFRMELMPGGEGIARVRPIQVSAAVQLEYPHITFVSDQFQEADSERLFWRVMRKSWERAYDVMSLSNPQHILMGGGTFGYDNRPVEGWAQALAPLVNQSVYNPGFNSRIEIALHELRVPGGGTTTLLVFDRLNKDHAVALIRTGTVINAVDLQMATYPVRIITQRRAIFPPHINVFFPEVQFTSVQLSDAERDALVQEPVARHHHALTNPYYVEHYRIPRLTALAMSLHPRLSTGVGLGGLDHEIIVLIAGMVV
jgi:hypothetical protein